MKQKFKNLWLEDSMKLNNIKFNIDLYSKKMMNKKQLIEVILKIINK